MTGALELETAPRLTLQGDTAADLMTENPVSIRDDAGLREAIVLLLDKGFNAAPVRDQAGRPVGVVSRADILFHDRAKLEYLPVGHEFYDKADLALAEGLPEGFQIEKIDRTLVRDIMTPLVVSVPPNTPAHRVVEDMLAFKVHRMFVVDAHGILLGVISALDVLRHLR